MLIAIIDKNGNAGIPTTKIGYVRKKIKDGKAKVIKGSFVNNNFEVVQILDLVINDDETVDKDVKFRIGIDPGYSHVGFCVIKETVKECKVLLKSDVELRTSDVTKGMTERAMYRNTRRRNRRTKALRAKASTGRPVKFRHPRWSNRRKKPYAPTHRHLIESHIGLIRKITKWLPTDKYDTEIRIEYFSFDSQKIDNPDIYPNEYSEGPQLGYANVKAYVLARDLHTCQKCSARECMLEVHHIRFRRDGGSNAPSNLITLCSSCHRKLHDGEFNIASNDNRFKYSGVLNSVMPEIERQLKADYKVIRTYGHITKSIRETYSIPKTHINDAMCISLSNDLGLDADVLKVDASQSADMNMIQYRRHNRALTIRREDRKYGIPNGFKANGDTKYKIVAWNRHARMNQGKDKPSLAQFKQKKPTSNPILIKAGRNIKRSQELKFNQGDIAYCSDEKEIFTVRGIGSTQGRLFDVTGEYHRLSKCFKVIQNRGLSECV